MLPILMKLETRLSNEFEELDINGLKCFLLPSGEVVNLVFFNNCKAVAGQYAQSIEDARKNLFEDGRRFFIEEMTEEEILCDLLQEMKDYE